MPEEAGTFTENIRIAADLKSPELTFTVNSCHSVVTSKVTWAESLAQLSLILMFMVLFMLALARKVYT